MSRFQGILAAAYTPLKNNGEINLPVIGKYFQHLVNNQVKGVFVNGWTGDFNSFTVTERKEILEKWKEVSGDEFTLIAQVGHTTVKKTQELAEHAGKCEVNAIALLLPPSLKLSPINHLLEYYEQIARVNPEIPFLYYHLPGKTGTEYLMADFLDVAAGRIPNLAGIKFTSPDLMDFKFCLEFDNQKFDMLYGMDEMMLGSLVFGANGWIGSTYNFATPVYLRIIDHYKNGDMESASSLQFKMMQFVKIVGKYGWPGASKSIMKLIGVDCGPTRFPNKNPSKQHLLKLEEELNEIGFFKLLAAENPVQMNTQ